MTSKKHRPWARELSEYWQRRGVIEWCEVRLTGCFGRYGLSPAHSKDRDEIDNKAEFFEVVAACKRCHDHLDQRMGKDERLELVRELIEKREQIIETA